MSGGNVPKGNQIVSHPIDLATGEEGAAGIALGQKTPTAEPDDKPLNHSQNNGVSTLTNPVDRSPKRQTSKWPYGNYSSPYGGGKYCCYDNMRNSDS